MECQRCGIKYPELKGRFCGACIPGEEGKDIKLTDYSKEFLEGIIDHKNEHIATLEAENARLSAQLAAVNTWLDNHAVPLSQMIWGDTGVAGPCPIAELHGLVAPAPKALRILKGDSDARCKRHKN